MKKTTELPEPDLRIWASQQLGVPAEASVREARASFLRLLGDHHFVPPPALQESVDWWMRPAKDKMFPSLTEQAFCEEETRLRNQVDEFGREYFLLDPAKRQRRYRVLVEQCAWSLPLSARLERMSGGLNLRAEPWNGQLPPRRQLVEHLCRLFVLPPRERVRRRIEVVRECESSPGPWQDAARGIQQESPELVSLEPFLIDELAWGKARRAQRPRLPKPVAPPVTVTGDGGGGSKWGYWVVLIFALMLVRMFTSGSNNPAPQRFDNFKAPQPPIFRPGEIPLNPEVLEQQRKMLEKLRRDLRDGNPNPEPGDIRDIFPQPKKDAKKAPAAPRDEVKRP